MSFPRYAAYKDSGVEWLGEVPQGWKVGAIKYFVRQKAGAIKTGPFGSHLTSVDMQAGEIKVYNQRSVIDSDFISGENFITQEKFEQLRSFETFAGDLLITTRGTIGRAAILPINAEKGILHPCLLRIQPNNQQLNTLFLKTLIQDSHLLKSQLSYLSNSTTIEVIYSETIASIVISVPPLDEQEAILNFLDCETAKIDNLINEQKKLIELLKEKRQAVISTAVTKGLNPHAPMKDSGVEWLGEVPEHWGVFPLKNMCELIKDGTHLPPPRVADGIPLLSVRNISNNGFFCLREDDSLISIADYNDLCRSFTPQKNDIILAIVGATLGKTAVIPDGLGCFQIQRSVAIFRTLDFIKHSWLYFSFVNDQFQKLLWQYASFSAQPGIYLGALTNFKLAFPDISEQTAILAFLDQETAKIDNLIQQAQKATTLLQERRTALISAAVTGKIDVRGFATNMSEVA